MKEIHGLDKAILTRREEEKLGHIEANAERAYEAVDTANFTGSVWHAVQAVADYDSHILPAQPTPFENEFAMQRVMAGMVLLNAFIIQLAKKKGFKV